MVYAEREETLRGLLSEKGWDVFVLPHANPYLMEFIDPAEQRVKWLTGFSGSSGTVIVEKERVLLFVDSRYDLQAREQTRCEVVPLSHQTPLEYLQASCKAGDVIALDPWLHTTAEITSHKKHAQTHQWQIHFTERNPIDSLWKERPDLRETRIVPYPCDESFQEKCARSSILPDMHTAHLLCDPTDIAWLLNLRGESVGGSMVPLFRAYALLFFRGERFHCDVFLEEHHEDLPSLENISFKPFSTFVEAAACFHSVHYEASKMPYAFIKRFPEILFVENKQKIARTRAVKQPREITSAIEAHRKDSVALTRFLHWLSNISLDGIETEISASKKLDEFRKRVMNYRGKSFETISAFGPNSAIIHYIPQKETDRPLIQGMYLLDSGGQYPHATTDVSRTIILGEPTPAQKEHFTHVLRAHIAAMTACMPIGARGVHLDAITRRPLWDEGLDFAHASGHGVGIYLSVHESPPLISLRDDGISLEEGMIFSNEPGYYRAGAYGIRLENVVRVIRSSRKGFLALDPLTLVPFDRNLIAVELLSAHERAWIDAYHVHVREAVLPDLIDPRERVWLEVSTAPL